MVNEVIRLLKPQSMKIYCDLTVGEGGHAEAILEASSPEGKLVGFDRDEKILEVARERLLKFQGKRVELRKAKFSCLKEEMRKLGIKGFDGILADFGISSFQLEDNDRGFSFNSDGFLDMRMDMTQSLKAWDIVNCFDYSRIVQILREYGQERYAGKISRLIQRERLKKSIDTSRELALLVRKAIGRNISGRIDSATRTFQALRIAVNDELGEISSLMSDVFSCLNPEGVFVCISYHSLEDSIVKKSMKEAQKRSMIKILTPKPLMPSSFEIEENRRARSARMRAAMKLCAEGVGDD